MKVAIITASFPFGFSEAFLEPELENLCKLGTEITLFPAVPRAARSPISFRAKVVPFRLLRPRTVMTAIYGFFRNPLGAWKALTKIITARNSLKTKIKNLVLFPTGLAVAETIIREGVEHVHAYWLAGASTVAYVAATVATVSWSFTAHSYDIFMTNNLIAEKVQSATFGRAISELGRRGILRHISETEQSRIKVVHLGVAVAEPNGGATVHDGELRILCPASLLPVKGHVFLLQALELIHNNRVPFRCTLAGDGPLKAGLQRMIKRLDLEKVVDMIGIVPHDVLTSQLYSGHYDISVLSSIEIFPQREGIPVSLMESMAAAVPCVATRTGAIDELIDNHCGMLVDQKDSVGLAKAIVTLAKNPGLRKALGSEARQRVMKHFDARFSAQILMRLMREHTEPIA